MDINQIVNETAMKFDKHPDGSGTRSLWYLATPYSKYPFGQKQAYIDASAVAGALLKRGVPVFCPIAHSHPIAAYGDCDALDHDIWLPLDEHMMKACAGVIVVKLAGWKDSYGVNWEIEWFRKACKPVLYLDPQAGDVSILPPINLGRAEAYIHPDAKAAEGVESPTLGDAVAYGLIGAKAPRDDFREAEGYYKGQPQSDTVKIDAERIKNQLFGAAVDKIMPSTDRKNHPLARGVLDYFPDALMEVAAISKAGNDKHNPGEELHHARGKSTDHADCIMRHLKDRGTIDAEDGRPHSGKVAWRALALLQEELEAAGAPLARGAKLPGCPDTAAREHIEMNGESVELDNWFFNH